MTAEQREPTPGWTQPPPGDRREQLPDDILAAIRPTPYLSTACHTAFLCDVSEEPAEALDEWSKRLHARCRINNKFTGKLCVCPCHQEQPAAVATPHQEPEADANGWTLKDDGIWTLPVDGGTVLMTRQTTPEERARFAEQWARDTKTKPGDDWAQKDDGTWKLTVKVGHHHSAAFRADESSTPWYRAQFARIAKAVSPILEEWPEHNRIDEHEHVTNAITEAVLAVLTPKEGRQ